MSATDPPPCIDALLAEQTWLRRLAGALTHDGDAAEDLAQETWVTALAAPPRLATRTWLGKVFRSRLYDHSRSRQRRALREQTVYDHATEPVATPEEITARVELLRRVAGHMLALDQGVRQVLYLRYVDDLEPVEIARRLHIPDGTVRWRLKQGLDDLRARLDAENGGHRRRWLAVLAPAPAAQAPSPAAHPGAFRTACLTTLPVAILVSLVVGPWPCSAWRPVGAGNLGPDAQLAALQADAAAARRLGHGPRPSAVEAAALCPEAEALEAERDALADATKSARTSAKNLFLQSPPDTVADQRLAQDVDVMIKKAGKCGHSFECRGQACKLALLVTELITKEKGWSALECFDAATWDAQVHPRLWWVAQHEYGGFTFDPLSQTGFKKIDVYFRLLVQGVAAGEKQLTLPAGWDRDRGPIPEELTPACRARVERVRGDLATLARQISRTAYLNEVFEQSMPRPDLARELTGLLRPHLAREGQPLPVEVTCQGMICTLMPRAEVPESVVNWRCMSGGRPGGSSCWGRWDDDGWFARLVKARLQLPLENLVTPVQEQGRTLPAYVTFRPRDERQGVSGRWWVRQLLETLDYAGMVTACERSHPAQGSLTLMARVPETCATREEPEESLITIQYGGKLMNSELADCLRTTLDPALGRLHPPGCTYPWLHEWRLDFPHPSLALKASDEE
jgi:RNA polymerase sigma-70 factor (ECF subfamily)